jgi:hypothetical protein
VNAVATATALTSSLDPSVFGQSVTFTATVNPSSGPTARCSSSTEPVRWGS